jgi:hypothetical protein
MAATQAAGAEETESNKKEERLREKYKGKKRPGGGGK